MNDQRRQYQAAKARALYARQKQLRRAMLAAEAQAPEPCMLELLHTDGFRDRIETEGPEKAREKAVACMRLFGHSLIRVAIDDQILWAR